MHSAHTLHVLESKDLEIRRCEERIRLVRKISDELVVFARHRDGCQFRRETTLDDGGMEDMHPPTVVPARPCTCGLEDLLKKLHQL